MARSPRASGRFLPTVTAACTNSIWTVQRIAQVNTFSRGGERARQNFVLYGSSAAIDPGWDVADAQVFTPIIAVDARQDADYKATSIRPSNGQPLGSYRWLVWEVFPINDMENTAFQELQVIPAKGEEP